MSNDNYKGINLVDDDDLEDDDEYELVAQGFNDEDGLISFDDLELTEEGVHTYVMRETAPGGKGWTVDEATCLITVTVTDNEGILSATVAYPSASEYPQFHNTYGIAPHVSAKKQTVGAFLDDLAFTFGIYEEDGELIGDEVNSDDSGDFGFDLPELEPGAHTYYIRETGALGDGWWVPDTNSTGIPVLIDVSEGSDDELTCTVKYNGVIASNATFVNYYGMTANLSGTKTAIGNAMAAGQFTFAVYSDDNETLGTASSTASADGTPSALVFSPINFTQSGLHTLKIRETTSASNGWSIDGAEFTAIATVADDPGNYKTTVVYSGGVAPSFTNRYGTQATVTATKDTVGKALGNELFAFELEDEDGNTMIALNSPDGSIVFSGLNLGETGPHRYTMTELYRYSAGVGQIGWGGWIAGNQSRGVTITVSQGPTDQSFDYNVQFDDGNNVFVNTYGISLSSANGGLGGTKTTNLSGMPDGAFEFEATDGNGNAFIGHSTSLGTIVFDDMLYSEPGIHNYSIREIAPSDPNWTVDANAYDATVTVTRDPTSDEFSITLAYAGGTAPMFINTYTVSANVSAIKQGIGQPIGDGQFSFKLYPVSDDDNGGA